MWWKSYLHAIPAAAQSPYALVAYAIAAILMAFGGFKILKLKAVLDGVKKTRPNPEQFKEIVELATNTILPEKLSGEQWIRINRQTAILVFSIALLVVVLVIAVVALVTPSGK